MNNVNKDICPFYPGQPVPIEFFIGRSNEIQRISRAIKQVELGKSQAVFLTGEYGIGKSSLASFMRYYAEKENHLLGIHILLGGAQTLEDVATKTVESVIKAQIYEHTISEKIKNWLSKYISKQEFFGFSINLEALKSDSPSISHGYLPFLHTLLDKVKENGIKGIMLIFDEINGITKNTQFAHFIKTLVDENAINSKPLPLMLMLCGVEERRREMIQCHQPIERIFDIVEVKAMDENEMKDFFSRTFNSKDIKVKEESMWALCHYSEGFPKIMQIIGENVFWIDKDNIIDMDNAIDGILNAAKEVGAKFVDQQVYKALQSKDYHSILEKLAEYKKYIDLSFKKSDIEKELSDIEKRKFNNFLQRMKKLNVLKSGDEHGEYMYISRLIKLYIILSHLKKKPLITQIPSLL